jgi:ABC-type polysaccharide/polyol phosphate transport system ATPase subunit
MNLRVGFAASAMMDSDIYLFDEILAVGDKAFQQKCREHLQGLKQAGKTVVMVNHSLPDLKQFCDRILYLEDGHIKTTPPNSDSVGTHSPSRSAPYSRYSA